MLGKVLFIGGTGRSGTTIFKKILDNNFFSIPDAEIRYLSDPSGLIDFHNALCINWSPFRADYALKKFANLIRSSKAFLFSRHIRHLGYRLGFQILPYHHLSQNFSQLNSKEFINLFVSYFNIKISDSLWVGSTLFSTNKFYEIPKLSHQQFSDFIDYFMKNQFVDYPTKTLVDDSPLSILHYYTFNKIFPKSLFLHLYRDPCNVVESYLRQGWSSSEIQTVVDRVESIYNELAKLDNEDFPNYISVSFERLLTSKPYRDNIFERINLFLNNETSFNTSLLNTDSLYSALISLSPSDQKYVKKRLANFIDLYGYKNE